MYKFRKINAENSNLKFAVTCTHRIRKRNGTKQRAKSPILIHMNEKVLDRRIGYKLERGKSKLFIQ